ncbi:MAG TPA: hypothetical protein VJA94_09015 [Candidatus Angelobacter sp.]
MADAKRTSDKKPTSNQSADGAGAILSISYDEALLRTREWILKKQGFDVTSACGFTEGEDQARRGGFDLAIVGHSIPQRDKVALITEFKKHSQAPVLSLSRHGDSPLSEADHSILASEGPEAFVVAVRHVLGKKGSS